MFPKKVTSHATVALGALVILSACSAAAPSAGSGEDTNATGASPTPLQDTPESRATVLSGVTAQQGPTGGAVQSPSQAIGRAPFRNAAVPAGATPLASVSSTGGAGTSPTAGAGGTCPANVTNQGGGVLANPVVSRVFWGSWTTSESDGYDNTWSAMANTPAFYNRLTEYGVHVGASGARFNYSSGGTGSLTDSTINAGIKAAILAVPGYVPGAQEVFVTFLPSGTTSQTDVQNGWAGHHGHFSMTIGSSNYDVKFAVIEYSSDSTYTNPLVSHELSEAFTDPTISTWYDQTSGAEIGDLCRFAALPGGYANIAGVQVETVWSQVSCHCVAERNLDAGDYNATGLPNPTTFRPSLGQWNAYGSGQTWGFGQSGDVPYLGDFNGDGRTEFAVFRPSTGQQFQMDVGTGNFTWVSWGVSGDIPVPGDYDGDGKTDIATWRPATGYWNIIMSSNGSHVFTSWGVNGDIPVPGMWDLDHKTDLAVWRPSNGTFYVIPSTSPNNAFAQAWGVQGDVPLAGDYNGDGENDFAIFRPSEGRFYVALQNTNTTYSVSWGLNGDIPVIRDYNGDFQDDLAVWRPSSGFWNFLMTPNSSPVYTSWGLNGDIPVQETP